jgi:hypothetical protein
MLKHRHHIIPKHAGGSDEEKNLIELTVEEHAEAHKFLYETYGKHEDYLAWKGLEGIIPKAEIIQELNSLGGKKGGSKGGKKSAETHRKNKTGLFREDKAIQKMGAVAGASKGGKAGSKVLVEEKIGMFGYSAEEKRLVCSKGGKAAGRKNGKKLRDEQKGIFDPEKRKEYCSLGGKAQKGYKKHRHENGSFKMALPGSEKSKELLNKGFYIL